MAVAEHGTLGCSLLELRLLFEDHPTADLAVAMCERACTKAGRPISTYQELIRSMYQVPQGTDAAKWLKDELDCLHGLHVYLLETGVNRWLTKGRA